MNVILWSIAAFLSLGISSSLSIRIVNQGTNALVERLGRYNRTLGPGLNFIFPLLESIVLVESMREKVLDIEPQTFITKDNVSVRVDAVVYWRILDLQDVFYNYEGVEGAIESRVLNILGSAIGKRNLDQTYSSRDRINDELLQELDQEMFTGGFKIISVEIQALIPTPKVLESLEQERAAESKKRAKIAEAQGDVESINIIAEALARQSNPQEILTYLISNRYVQANEKLGSSDNTKILFMDPKALNESLGYLINKDGENFNGSD